MKRKTREFFLKWKNPTKRKASSVTPIWRPHQWLPLHLSSGHCTYVGTFGKIVPIRPDNGLLFEMSWHGQVVVWEQYIVAVRADVQRHCPRQFLDSGAQSQAQPDIHTGTACAVHMEQGCSICSVTTLWQHRDRIRDRIRDRTVIIKWQSFFSDHDRYRDVKWAHILGDMGRYRPISGDIGRYQAILGDIGRYQAILGDIGRYWGNF